MTVPCQHPRIGIFSYFNEGPPVFKCEACGAEPVIYFEDDAHDEAFAVAMEYIADVMAQEQEGRDESALQR